MSKTFGLLAYPTGHSLSPLIFNSAFKAEEVDATYRPFEIDEFGLQEFFDGMVKDEPINGFSVSLPHKESVIPYLNVVDENAKKIGAVNTVVNKGGFLHGYNTDYTAAISALKEVTEVKGKKVVVVGAGGATRAIVYGLLSEGASVGIYNRTESKATAMAEYFSELFNTTVESGSLEKMIQGRGGDILIQTTSIWTLNPEITPEEADKFIPSSFIEKFDTVFDVVYKPRITPLLSTAQRLGKKIVTGDTMLLNLAQEQYKLWLNQNPPVEVMQSALERGLA